MIELEFNSPYLSIESLSETELPDFTVITGKNGTGKSHLLQAIQNQHVRWKGLEQGENRNQQIRIYDWNSLAPQTDGEQHRQNLLDQTSTAIQNFLRMKNERNMVQQLRQTLSDTFNVNIGGDSPIYAIESYFDEQSIDHSKYKKMLGRRERSDFAQLDNHLIKNIQRPYRTNFEAVSNTTDKPLVALNQNDLRKLSQINWGEVDIFQSSFSSLFLRYNELRIQNQFNEFRNKHKGLDVDYLDDDQFYETYGNPPWDYVNSVLDAAGLRFFIDSPDADGQPSYQARLFDSVYKNPIDFGALSSGEKILMSFAFCLYNFEGNRQFVNHPKLLLFDEIDAPLHPSMVEGMLKAISETLVAGKGIKVIMTTHSPTTVALAPEGSIYIMNRETPRLEKSEKNHALNILTDGLPTVSIDYEGRRQVFVESEADAKNYSALYGLLKSDLQTPRSLEFVAAGNSKNGGCEAVIRIVSSLAEAGNKSVYGLVDWDGANDSDARVKVIAEGKSNGLENQIFDPLALAFLICRDCKAIKGHIGLDAALTYSDMLNEKEAKFQDIADGVTSCIFGSSPAIRATRRYCGGFSLELDERVFSTDDHKYEELIMAKLPGLASLSKQRAGLLMHEMIDRVFADKRSIIPADISDVFGRLLNSPVH